MERTRPAGPAYFAALLLLAGLCAAAPAAAQDGAVDPKQIVFEHDGKNVDGFVLYVSAAGNSSPVRLDLGALQPTSGKISVRVPVLPPGTYSLEIAAYNSAGESPRVPATPARFTITSAPPAITELTPRDPGNTTKAPASHPPQTKPEGKKKSGGILGRVWKGVVGDDGDASGK